MTIWKNFCNLAFTTSAFWVDFCHRESQQRDCNVINTSSLIWAAGELLCRHTNQLLSTLSDESVAVDSHDKSCDHRLYMHVVHASTLHEKTLR